MLIPLINKIKKRKKTRFVILKRPVYFGRHPKKDFLILATGPSLRKFKDSIQNFIERHKPITIGCNFLDNMFTPHYHIFVNRKRFCSYANYIDKKGIILLTPHILRKAVKAMIGERYYEEIMWKNVYPSDMGGINITRRGIIYSKGATVAPIACAVAVIMGARNIFVVGLDGYSLDRAHTHYYNEPDNKRYSDLLIQEKCTYEFLRDLVPVIKKRGGFLKIITPTAHKDYYDGSILK